MKNKIHKYDFLVIGAGLIGAITALALVKKKFKVLVIDKKNNIPRDNRTLAVNANSTDFLKQQGVWENLKSKPQKIEKIVIEDNINAQPLIFVNDKEPMGNVIFNKELHGITRKRLENLKILEIDVNLDLSKLLPNKTTKINKNNYLFKKIIVSIGKNIISDVNHKSIVFDQEQYSHVGFFKHSKNHNNTAYEIFTQDGPLAVLPSPSTKKNKSTFIYTSRKKIDTNRLRKIIHKKFEKSHGKLMFDKSISKFPITPHLTKNNKNFIYVGDSLKSIHPVAGQGWNLGIKDIKTLCKLLDQYSLEEENFNSFYYSRRLIESAIYFSFTSILNYLYESNSILNDKIIKTGYSSLKKIKFVRDIFIKQAMGRINLTD